MLHDMIERIEHFAQVQADFPVYNILEMFTLMVI